MLLLVLLCWRFGFVLFFVGSGLVLFCGVFVWGWVLVWVFVFVCFEITHLIKGSKGTDNLLKQLS